MHPVESDYPEHIYPLNSDYINDVVNQDYHNNTHPVKVENLQTNNDFHRVYSVDIYPSARTASIDVYHNSSYSPIRLKDQYLECDERSSYYTEKHHKKKIRRVDKPFSQNMWPYPERRPTNDFYKSPSLGSSTDRTRGGSLMCTH